MKRNVLIIVIVTAVALGLLWAWSSGVFAGAYESENAATPVFYALKPTFTPAADMVTAEQLAALSAAETADAQVKANALTASGDVIVIPDARDDQADQAVSEVPPLLAGGTRQSVPVAGAGEHLVAIDAGHGGIDEGTYPYNPNGTLTYNETQINLKIALRLRDILVANNIRVFLTRDGDYAINPNWLDINGDGINDLGDESQARLDLINASGAELLLALHQNARTYGDGSMNPEYNGSTTYYCADRPFSDLSYRFAELVHSEVLGGLASIGYDSFDQGVIEDLNIDEFEPRRHLIVLGPQSDRIARPSQMPAALDEPLFATHREESILLSRPDVLEALAQAYARAIIRYFNEVDAR